MFCENCGAFDTEEANFCSRCGESLSEGPRRERFAHLRNWGKGVFLQGLYFIRVLLDFSFHQPFLKRIGFLYRLSILSVLLFAFLVIVMGFEPTPRFGMIILLMMVTLAFLLMVMCSRIVLELGSVISRMESLKTPTAEKLEPKDQIEWNIE